MEKTLNLRQVEAFKAVIEHGTVNRAAEALAISQPAVSKLLIKLEHDTRLPLFERVKGKLAPTPQGMRLYEDVERIFAGLRQIEESVANIRREEQRKLSIGVMPALSGSFVRRVTMAFIKKHPDVEISIHTRSSQFLAEWLIARQIDVALVGDRIENPYIDREPMMSSPLCCALPIDHPLTRKRVIRPWDLDNVPYVAFAAGSQTDRLVRPVFDQAGIRLKLMLRAVTAPTLCEFVAEGLGVSLVHPLFTENVGHRVVLRRFEPAIPAAFQLCRVRASRNALLVDAYLDEARHAAEQVSQELFKGL